MQFSSSSWLFRASELPLCEPEEYLGAILDCTGGGCALACSHCLGASLLPPKLVP